MANPPLTASLPEMLALGPGFTVALDAIDPATGDPVAGVLIPDATLTAWDASPKKLPDNPPPLLTHVEA